eukprot:6076812-Lingulodinium_polyedra.AAC.1
MRRPTSVLQMLGSSGSRGHAGCSRMAGRRPSMAARTRIQAAAMSWLATSTCRPKAGARPRRPQGVSADRTGGGPSGAWRARLQVSQGGLAIIPWMAPSRRPLAHRLSTSGLQRSQASP